MTIEYHPAVEQELREARDFFETRVAGLGLEFIRAVEQQVLGLAESPGRWMIVRGEIRRCLMRRFPYEIYSRALDAGDIRVTAVKHQRRRPSYGLDRR